MANTPHLAITLLEQSQAQKEVTVNEAFYRIDALLNSGVIDKDLSTPPDSPAQGDVYIVADSPTDAWSGKAKHVAYFDQIWRFIEPNEGLMLWVSDENVHYVYDGSAWDELDVGGGGGGGSGDMEASTYDPANIAQQVVGTTATQTLDNKTLTAPTINGATMTGNVTVPTQSANDNSTKAASTAYVDAAVQALPKGSLCPAQNLVISTSSVTAMSVAATAVILYHTSSGLPFKFMSLSETLSITGSGVNGLDMGSEASSTWYHIWAIGKADGTLDTLLSLSTSAPTMPSGYVYKGYLGAVYNDSSSNFISLSQRGANVKRTSVSALSGGTSTSSASVSLSAIVPSTAQAVEVDVYATRASGSSTVYTQVNLDSANTFGYALFANNPASSNIGTSGAIQVQKRLELLTAQTLWYLVGGTGSTAYIYILGWEY